MVGTLNKLLSQVWSNFKVVGDTEDYLLIFAEMIEDLLAAFKSKQIVYPSRVIIYRYINNHTNSYDLQYIE